MSDVFVSFKREDEARVGQLVRALERSGLSTWWDQGLVGGANWRQEIHAALERAKCVIVVWTEGSVGLAGDFVREEAAHAKRRGILVPVRFDAVEPPLGFGEIQAIDLTRWRGGRRDPFFADLTSAVRAKLEGRPAPAAKAPMRRLVRRLAYGGASTAVMFSTMTIGFNLFDAQNRACAIPFMQPQISDACGAVGLGRRPTSGERLAWEQREPASCAALRTHIERFPEGIYREAAADMLSAVRVTRTERWTPGVRRLRMFVGQSDVPSATRAAAEAASLVRGGV